MEPAISQIGAFAAALADCTDEAAAVEQAVVFTERVLGGTASVGPLPSDGPAGPPAVLLESGLGGLAVTRPDAPLSADEQIELETLARLLDLRVETLRSLAASEERGRLLERLTRIQRSISHRAPLQEVLDSITAGAAELLGGTMTGLRLLDPLDAGSLLLESSCGMPDDLRRALRRGPVTQGVSGRAITDQRLVVVTDYEESPLGLEPIRAQGVQTAMAAPVHVDGVPAGALSVASFQPGRQYTPTEQAALLALAEHASLALGDARTVASMREAQEAKDLFLAMVSHELKTPLTVIMGALKTVEHHGESLDADQRSKLLSAAFARGRDLERLINSLLQSARAELTRTPHDTVALERLVTDAVEGFEHVARLRVDDLPEVDLTLDIPAARAILGSLLENAVAHSPAGSEITLAATRDGDTVLIEVCNEGTLPDDVEPEELFNPFQRGASARSSGVGLGLHIAARLAESLEGAIEMSQVGGWVTFGLRLPVHATAGDSATA